LKFVPDSVTNTILVLNADTKQLAEIKSLIEMYDSPDSIDSQSVRKTKIISLKYGDAEEIAEVVKDVFRDLLSPNDKALLKNAQPQQQQEQRFNYWETIDGDDSEDTKVPRFKGLLSIGIDKKTNQLVVSSPEFLMVNVQKMIEELDEAAKATLPVVQVIKVRPHVSGTMVREALADYAKGGTSTTPGAQQNQGDNEAGKAGAKAMRDGEKAEAAESDGE
jgi:type II secretory pathway component GspD/PulD (secretin)